MTRQKHPHQPLFSLQTKLSVLASVFINLSSSWFGVLIITPGIFGVGSLSEYLKLLLLNLPFGIVGLLLAFWLTERGRVL